MPAPDPDPENGGDAPPSEFDLAGGFAEDVESRPADERVYRAALELYEPTSASEVAERADCSVDTARRHLRRLADIGVVERTSEQPEAFRRNESYFEWRKRNRLEQLSDAELSERLAALTERERAFRERYDAEGPAEVDALDHADYADVEDVWLDLSEWETVRERIRRIEDVRQNRSSEPGVA